MRKLLACLVLLLGGTSVKAQQLGSPLTFGNVGEPVGSPVGRRTFGSSMNIFGDPAAPIGVIGQQIDPSLVIAPSPFIPGPQSQGVLARLWDQLASLIPFRVNASEGPVNGWFPSLRRRNVERHRRRIID